LNKSDTNPSRHWLDSWHVDPTANRTYDFIDGLRGIAILMVLVCHSVYAREQHEPFPRYILAFTGTFGRGVDLFFTISGFLIAWPFWKRKTSQAPTIMPTGYGWRRFWKIYPPLALSVLLLTPVYIITQGHASDYLRAAACWLTGVSFLIPVSGIFNPVMWSLVVEIHFYMVLPLLFLLTKPLSSRACLWIISLLLLVVPNLIQFATGLHPTFYPEIYDPFCTGLSSFCFGVAVAGIDTLKVWNKKWAMLGDAGWSLIVIGLAGMAWYEAFFHAVGTFPGFYLAHWTFLLGSGCVLCYAANPENARARWLCAPWLRWCGIISYEWYLLHQPIINLTRHYFGPTEGNIFKYGTELLFGMTTSVILAAVLYRTFSLPILQYGRSRKASRPK